jgi:hypothetical protein
VSKRKQRLERKVNVDSWVTVALDKKSVVRAPFRPKSLGSGACWTRVYWSGLSRACQPNVYGHVLANGVRLRVWVAADNENRLVFRGCSHSRPFRAPWPTPFILQKSGTLRTVPRLTSQCYRGLNVRKSPGAERCTFGPLEWSIGHLAKNSSSSHFWRYLRGDAAPRRALRWRLSSS